MGSLVMDQRGDRRTFTPKPRRQKVFCKNPFY